MKEKQIQQDIRAALLMLGFDVVSFSQPRATMQTMGIPDLYARHMAWQLRVWIEVKTPAGKLSLDQVVWHEVERSAGGTVLVARSAKDAIDQIAEIRSLT